MAIGKINVGGGSQRSIKSFQSGVVTIPYNVTYVDVTVSSVDTTKVGVIADSVTFWSYGGQYNEFQAYMTSATNLRIERTSPVGTAGYNVTVTWQLFEFNGVKSRQEISYTYSTAGTQNSGLGCYAIDYPISSVVPANCLVLITARNNDYQGNTSLVYMLSKVSAYVSSATTLTFLTTGSNTTYIRAQIIEFA